jgi:hypothetical protein
MSEHEEMENAIAAWVLGAADSKEAEEIAMHIEGCASCRETAARLTRVAGAMPLDADEVEPPARLRQRILAAAATSPRTLSAPARAADRAVRIPPRRAQSLVRLVDRVPLYAAAAVVVIALAVGLVAGDLVGHLSQPAAPSQVARFTLVGHGSMASARGTVIDLKSDGIALVDFNGLPALAGGKVYELWLITPGSKRVDGAGVFVPDSNGTKVLVVSRPLSGYSTMAVTTEQGPDGVAAPTQQPQLAGGVA